MEIKATSMFGVLAAFILVASLIVPYHLANPSGAEADPGICKWDVVNGPNALPLSTDVCSPSRVVFWGVSDNSGLKGSELHKLVTGHDDKTVLAGIVYPIASDMVGFAAAGMADAGLLASPLQLGTTRSIAINWSPFPYWHLCQAMRNNGYAPTVTLGGIDYYTRLNVWNMAIAPDDPKFWAVVTSSDNATFGDAPLEVYITSNAGASWQRTNFADIYQGQPGGPYTTGFISAIDISPSYGDRRDIAVGIRNGALANNGARLDLWCLQSSGFGGWVRQDQLWPSAITDNVADVMALKFSPTYPGDASLAVVFSDNGTDATYYDIALRDLNQNRILRWVNVNPVEVKSSAATAYTSPGSHAIISADLELPSDFSGQSPSLRRAYVSIDAVSGNATALSDNTTSAGIYRIDDTSVSVLMDNSTQSEFGRRIGSIAYFGTYASGKLLAGEVIGDSCNASVMTWFTDSPASCGGTCFFPALKPPTGAAGMDLGNWDPNGCTCAVGGREYGNAQVAWRSDGTLSYAATGFYVPVATDNITGWWFDAVHPLLEDSDNTSVPRFHDETALSISRNNGETWNQINYIDTNLNQNPAYISWLNDLAPAPDCSTVYLASVSQNATHPCIAFDSVWRASINPSVVAPLPAIAPLGFYWERVLTRPSAVTCNQTQSDLPILRLAPDMEDGQAVGWAAQNTRAQMWSPDFGDFWAIVTPKNNIQDFAFESSILLWNLASNALVQKLPYTGTAWSSAEPDIDFKIGQAHMIAVKPEGKILVGGGAVAVGNMYPVSYSVNGGHSVGIIGDRLPTAGNVHVAFDSAFKDNYIIYAADDSAAGTIYRYQLPFPVGGRWIDNDMLAATNGNCMTEAAPFNGQIGYFGLQAAFTGGALYGASNNTTGAAFNNNSGVSRTLWPLNGMPKPGIAWDFLRVFTNDPGFITFTREPWSLKLCGCLTTRTDTILYAIDARPYNVALRQGLIWAFTDCMAKKGPTLITADGTLIGCDPVSGRAQEVNLCWEQLCVADAYDLEIAKDKDFTIRVIDVVGRCATAGFIAPVDVLKPCVYFPAGAASTQIASAIGAVGAGGGAIAGLYGELECGHKYFWRVMVRRCATTQLIHSPWSEIRSFTIKAGLPVRADYYGLKLLAPDNGCVGCPVKPASFSWSPFKETTKYKFVLAKDAAMTQVVAEAEVPTTAYEYKGTLDYSTNYFWRVMSLEPAPSDWSATFSFQTEAAPPPPAAPEAAPPTPLWLWIIVAIGAILVVIIIVLLFTTRQA